MTSTPTTGRRAAALLVLALLAGAGAPARAAPPSDASIAALMDVMQARSMVDAMRAGLEATIRQSMQSAVAGRTLSAEQARVMQAAPARVAAAIAQDLTWDVIGPLTAQVYRETFTQDEVDGLVAFYRTPTGQALIRKMPQVTQRSMQLVQARVAQSMPRIVEATRQALVDAGVEPRR